MVCLLLLCISLYMALNEGRHIVIFNKADNDVFNKADIVIFNKTDELIVK